MQTKHNIMSKEFTVHVSDPQANKKLDQLCKQVKSIEKRLPKPETKYVARKQLSEILDVSVVTLIDWDKKGILKPLRIGNRVRYRMSDIELILEESTNKK